MNDRDTLGEGDISRDAHEAAELAEAERQLARAARATLGLPDHLHHRIAVEVRDLAVLEDLLGDEPNDLQPVLGNVGHRGLHVELVAVAPDTRPERRVHRLHAVDVPRGNQDEIGGDRLGLDHRAGRPLGLAYDRELPLLERGEERMLTLDLEEVDLVQEQDTTVRLVDRADLDPLVRRGLETAGLERVVFHVPEERAGVSAGGVDERGLVVGRMRNKELRDPRTESLRPPEKRESA